MTLFNPKDWYWFVDNDQQLYSSARNIYVNPQTDSGYQNWMTSVYGVPAVTLTNEAEIWYYAKEFQPAWLWNGATMSQPAANQYTTDQLKAYAETVRETAANGGMTAEGIPIKTDDFSRTRITNARLAATKNAQYSTTILGSDGNIYPVTDTQILAISDDVIAFGTSLADTYAQMHDGIDGGTITTLSQIDSAFASVSKTQVQLNK
jgi:hypothetical protein